MIVQQHFHGIKSRAMAMALATGGLNLGAMLTSPFTRLCIDHYGWRSALILIAGCILQLLVPAALFREPTKVATLSSTPLDQQEAEAESDGICPRVIAAYFQPEFSNADFVLFLCGAFTIYGGFDSIYVRSAARAELVGIDPLEASLIMTLVNPPIAFGRALGGFLAGWIKPLTLFGIGLVSGGVTVILSALFSYDIYAAHTIFCSSYGITFGM